MIFDPKDYAEGTTLEAYICIIGGGPAAISIALRFADQNRKIIMLTGGSWSETPQNRELNKGFVEPAGSHEPLEQMRRRVFGGATSIWGGRCLPLDPIDFEERPWIPYSGWPVSYDQLTPYYSRAMQLCETGENNFDAREMLLNKKTEIITGIDNQDIVSYKLEKWSPPTRFAHKYKKALHKNSNIDVYLDAHVVRINTEEKSDEVSSVTVVVKSSVLRVVAEKFVLAAGGIENPRLLLASKSGFHPNGIGNQHDNVGRFYMCHIMGTFGTLDPYNRKEILFDFEKDINGVICRRRWWFTGELQQKMKIGNAIMYLSGRANLTAENDPKETAVLFLKTLGGQLRKEAPGKLFIRLKEVRKDITKSTYIILKNSFSVIPHLLKSGWKRLIHQRSPFILPSVHSPWLYLYFQTEHMPNPESRIILSEAKDRLGIPLPVIKPAFSDIDIDTLVVSHEIFFERFETQNKGRGNLDSDHLRQFVQDKIRNFNSGAHHLGTTRMAADPRYGVVDGNCQVHGVSNLFVAGSSVFPTGGHANPTLTLIALAVKLADFLTA